MALLWCAGSRRFLRACWKYCALDHAVRSIRSGRRLPRSEFCNAVLNGIFETSNEGSSWPGFLAKKACAQLPESSPLRSLLIDVWVGAGEQSYETDSGDLLHGPREFWVQVSKRQARAIRSGISVQNFSSIKHRCDYHYHKEGDKCEGAAV